MRASINVAIAGLLYFSGAALIAVLPAFAADWKPVTPFSAAFIYVGAMLIEEELAVPFVCGSARCPRTPRPWC
jgi:hypothetical protein